MPSTIPQRPPVDVISPPEEGAQTPCQVFDGGCDPGGACEGQQRAAGRSFSLPGGANGLLLALVPLLAVGGAFLLMWLLSRG